MESVISNKNAHSSKSRLLLYMRALIVSAVSGVFLLSFNRLEYLFHIENPHSTPLAAALAIVYCCFIKQAVVLLM